MLTLNQIKSKQKTILIGGVALFICLLVFGLYISDPNKGEPTALEQAKEKQAEVKKNFTSRGSDGISAEEVWINKSETRLTKLAEENTKLQKTIQDFQKLLEENQKKLLANSGSSNIPPPNIPFPGKTNGINYPPVPKAPIEPGLLQQASTNSMETAVEQQRNAPKLFPSATPQPPVNMPATSALGKNQGNTAQVPVKPLTGLFVMDVSEEDIVEEDSNSKGKHVSHYMPAGSFAKAILLIGVDAPTGGMAKTNPIPVLLRIVDLGQLPNFFKTEIKNCHVTGAAWGNISDERVYVRTELISCVLKDGTVAEVKISGSVSGEDGKNGIRGTVVSKQGAMMAKAAFAGIASGMGDAVQSQYKTQQTSPLGTVSTLDGDKVIESGLAEGFGNAMGKIADFWIARANETYPIIEVGPKRIVELTTTEGVDFGMDLTGNVRMEMN